MPFDELAIGARVRVMPNHACMMAAGYDRHDVVAVWDRANRW